MRCAALALILVLAFGAMAESSAEATLSPEVLDRISESVMEVVAPKPGDEAVQYEKPLPWDQVPFAVRNDKYFSIGTAFAIGPAEFVSAAHVMYLGAGGTFKGVSLRDKRGNIYPIDRVLKYSLNRDFIVFTVKGGAVHGPLPLNTTPTVNRKVYAVGNALGQGIVIRDGLYTSDTPEEAAGEWNWIRFSAAASPGNSGGPLIDEDGAVIGIVLRKSPGENLNYACPISEVMAAPDTVAVVQKRISYHLDNMDMKKKAVLKKQVRLPASFEELDRQIGDILADFARQGLDSLLKENREGIFPRGRGSRRLLQTLSPAFTFPVLITKQEDGNWAPGRPKELKNADLGSNGRLTSGSVGKTVFLKIRKPDTISSREFMGNSKVFMDLLLKGFPMTRTVGSEKIKITSMGAASEEYRYTDSYKRVWFVRSWLLNFTYSKVVTFSLPVPEGVVVLLRADKTGKIDQEHIQDLKVLTDFVNTSYDGTVEEWKAFLQTADILPDSLSRIRIDIEGKKLSYRSSRLAFSSDDSFMSMTGKSYLRLNFGFFEDEGTVAWDVNGILLSEDRRQSTNCLISRLIRPEKDLPESSQASWTDARERRHPYNRSAYYKDGLTLIHTILDSKPSDGRFLYAVSLSEPGTKAQAEMESRLDRALAGITVLER